MYVKRQRTRISNLKLDILKRLNWKESTYQIHYMCVVIKAVRYYWTDRHIQQWNRIENSETDLQIHPTDAFTKMRKQFSGGKITFSSYGNGTRYSRGKEKKNLT